MNDLRRLFGFFTIFPLSRPDDSISAVGRACYLLPVVGIVTGALAGLAGWGAAELWGGNVSAAFVLATALLLTGFHHADGLADMGDALMARGDSRRRLEVLKDRTLGVGAVAVLLLTYLVSWAAVLDLLTRIRFADIAWYMICAEVAARLPLLLVALSSPSSHEGSGRTFVESVRGGRGAAGIASTLALLALAAVWLHPGAPALALAGALLTAALVSAAGRLWFGGVGGDLLGASVELGRMTALLGLAASVYAWPPA